MDENQQKSTLSSTLSERQERAIVALLSSNSINGAMKRIGINRTTFYTWLRDPVFCRMLKDRQTALHEAAMADLKAMLAQAVEELGALMVSKNERTRMSAVKEVLGRTSATFENQSLTERIEILVKQLATMEANK